LDRHRLDAVCNPHDALGVGAHRRDHVRHPRARRLKISLMLLSGRLRSECGATSILSDQTKSVRCPA
jgi:hypothetical protein